MEGGNDNPIRTSGEINVCASVLQEVSGESEDEKATR